MHGGQRPITPQSKTNFLLPPDTQYVFDCDNRNAYIWYFSILPEREGIAFFLFFIQVEYDPWDIKSIGEVKKVAVWI